MERFPDAAALGVCSYRKVQLVANGGSISQVDSSLFWGSRSERKINRSTPGSRAYRPGALTIILISQTLVPGTVKRFPP